MSEFDKDRHYYDIKYGDGDEKKAEALLKKEVETIINDHEEARKKRIDEAMLNNPTFSREEAEEHIDYMDSLAFDNWISVSNITNAIMDNKVKKEIHDAQVEEKMQKDMEIFLYEKKQ